MSHQNHSNELDLNAPQKSSFFLGIKPCQKWIQTGPTENEKIDLNIFLLTISRQTYHGKLFLGKISIFSKDTDETEIEGTKELKQR